MTPEQQRIAIADACGWKWEILWTGELHGKPIGEQGPFSEVPDYLNDLNAMHDAWLTLSPSEKEQFESELYSIVIGRAEYNRNDDAGWITNATAAQRAEAFLKTLNIWTP